jgi:hypothetical protein
MILCRHPACETSAQAGSIYCGMHRYARDRAKAAKANVRRNERRKDTRAAKINDAIALLKRAGYAVEIERHMPEAFPS